MIQARAISRETHCSEWVWQDRTAWKPMGSSHVPRREGRLELVTLRTVTLFLKPALIGQHRLEISVFWPPEF